MTCVILFKLSQLSPVCTDFLKRNLGHSDALLWNSLPESIRAIRSIGKFKKEINPVQVVCALRPQCIILRDFQYGGRLLWCERLFAVHLFISFSAFAHLFYTKMLYLESLGVVKSDFGIEVLTFRACPGNLWHFSNKVKFFHFRLRLVGRNFWSLTAFGYWCSA